MRRIWVLLLAAGILAGSAVGARVMADDSPGGPATQPAGPGGPGGGPRRGPGGFHLLPPFVVDKLNLTDDQTQQIAELEKETKAKLEQILTPEQVKILETARPPHRSGQGHHGSGGQGGSGGEGPGGGGQGGPGGTGGEGPGGGGQGGPGNGPPPQQ